MKHTVEKKEAVKNGVLRMVVVVVSMVIGVLALFAIIVLAGQKAGLLPYHYRQVFSDEIRARERRKPELHPLRRNIQIKLD